VFGNFEELKSMRLSNRDLVLVIGIVVAVVITLTALVYKDQVAAAKQELRTPRKTSLNATAHKLLEFIGKHSSVKHFQ
jgi:hypothetical protein